MDTNAVDLSVNPVYWRLSSLLSLDPQVVHRLALRATGTLTAYRLVLGRCLLAMRDGRRYREFGCSSATHYAQSRLGLDNRLANSCQRVARELLALPALSRAAEEGQIAWGKIREIVRKATPETEEYWLALSARYDDSQIQALVSKTPRGAVPGDVDVEDTAYRCELRCRLSPEVFKMLEQARRVLSLERDEAVTNAQLLELSLASYISKQPLDEKALRMVREEADKDLQAERAKMIPVVREARELARTMGVGSDSERLTRPGPSEQPESLPDLESVNQLLAKAVRVESLPNTLCLESLRAADNIEAQAKNENPWTNTRLRFNPKSRFATKAQKKEILRRDNWCCGTPGCPNRIWLHTHHLESYAQGGGTEPTNLICLCSGCHRNLHRGHLIIAPDSKGKLVYRNARGERLDVQVDLEIAAWVNYELGWTGGEDNCYVARWYKKEWAVFAA